MYVGQVPSTIAPAASPSFADIVQQVVPAALQLYRESQATKLQMKRAEQGLPPLPLDYYSPPVRVEASVDRSTQMILAGLGIAGALGLLFLLSRGRRG